MRNFGYFRTTSAAEAVQAGTTPQVHILAGGTNLVDLLKYRIEQPAALVDINRLPWHDIEELPDGGLRLGALTTNAATAYDVRVRARYPLLSSAILAGASAQLRNAATNGGNLNQRTRCPYFYDVAAACNKRTPGSGCAAIGGHNRDLAILGASESCIATFPSDMAVALRVLEAQVRLLGPDGERVVPIADYHRLPGAEPWRDNNLLPGELVTAIDLPPSDFGQHYTYLKIRDRLSYAFALVSVAVAMRLDEAGRIQEARIALGGVAPKPWRVASAEAVLEGQLPSAEAFGVAADELLAGALGQGENDFKLTLARRTIVRACQQAAAGTPQSQSDKHIR
ncbi:xanthine dehydrogenase family protein subunit M [Hymenobacter sp. GOD-10R]|uniref:FAD binding domain-containing protein n=1 Tax=Hymenobacter sp. GOD-10R TaxID=3093922 RepID=UPI002D78DC5C|nr:xanthine dehydrogenase family protein subunit M [Hymenobacter sp. GOD-10R]WRQ31290.1 xanthine dehydrogenase family protein subunit M [Hymenobacter sp. GOD-10R]